MKRLLVVLVLTLVVVAVAASPAYAYLDAHGAGSAATTAPTVTVPHAGILGVSATDGRIAQAAMTRGRGLPNGVVPASRGGAGAIVVMILAVVIGATVSAIVAERRRPQPAVADGELVRFRAHGTATSQGRTAA
jgi:hypothetical protein